MMEMAMAVLKPVGGASPGMHVSARRGGVQAHQRHWVGSKESVGGKESP